MIRSGDDGGVFSWSPRRFFLDEERDFGGEEESGLKRDVLPLLFSGKVLVGAVVVDVGTMAEDIVPCKQHSEVIDLTDYRKLLILIKIRCTVKKHDISQNS